MRLHIPAAVALLLAGQPLARADGCKFHHTGRLVPEREQRAFVEWADGTETLYVATLADPTSDGSVWVVPVRAAAPVVRAEPVEEFPAVTYYDSVASAAERRLKEWIAVTALMDSGGCCLPFVLGGCSGAPAAKSAVEMSRVERLGMVVTVVSAGSRAAIEQYMDAQGVNRAAADLSSLEPYFGKDGFAFVCGWVGLRNEPVTATGLKVVFPSPTLWFPLLPTRAYTEPVETVVYARGFVKPAAGCDLPGLRCEYVGGTVESRGVRQAFADGRPRRETDWSRPLYESGRLERLTRVALTNDPQQWDRDLELVPGTTPTGTAAVAVVGWGGFLGPLWSALLGAALGLVLPWVAIPDSERRRRDWLAGALTGAAIAGTVWASVVVYSAWRWRRFPGSPSRLELFALLPLLAAAHFGVVWAVCHGLMAWIAAAG